ncbi:MAG: threonylcarbamoyl-AMP synthase [Fimbriimonadaceae bacterium]|nr:threonylcarbamoyl-AMP synthase [Chitinophagales bacterium]
MIGKDIFHAANLLKQGDVVAIPTETVYGLAGNAFNTDAVLKIFTVKNRPHFNPLIVHTNTIEKIESFITSFPQELKKLASLWPGPITILLPKSNKIHDLITAGAAHVAVRIPNHPLTLELLSNLDFPLCAPSANPFGYISPTTAVHVEKQLGDKISYILDGGQCDVGIESTIIKLNINNKIEILRTGGIPTEQIASITGYQPEIEVYSERPDAPGMLKSHYSPSIPLIIGDINTLLENYNTKKIALLNFNKPVQHASVIFQITLSPKGNLNEAATNLFSALHELDASNAEIIIATRVPDIGIGKAINDRLMRAAANKHF